MIVKGVVERLSGGSSYKSGGGLQRLGYRDSLTVSGHPEIRRIRGTTYIIDHVESAVGNEAVIGLAGGARVVVAVKYNGRTYSETSFQTVMNSLPVNLTGCLGFAVLLASVVAMVVYGATVPVLAAYAALYVLLRIRVRSLISAVERA